MKPGDKVKIEIRKSKSMEKLEKEGVAGVRLILKPSAMIELEGKELMFIRDSQFSKNFAILRTPEGNEYEVLKDLLKEIE